MKKILNYLADFAGWAGEGDHFIGFVRIFVALVIVAAVIFAISYWG